jgi:putative modified peptide
MAKTKTAPLDPKIADKLLDLLSTDNEFRRLFKKDPLSALKKVGYKAPGETSTTQRAFSACCSVQRIAPKADIIKARAEIKSMLTSGLSHTTPQLDAAITTARRSLK